MMLKKVILTGCLSVAFFATTFADTFEEGIAAFQSGDYETAFTKLYDVHTTSDHEYQDYATLYIGMMYANGFFVKQDSAMAFRWIDMAAKDGCAEAEFYKGVFYSQGGGGVEQNIDEAYKWIISAGEKGFITAQEILGNSYAEQGDIANSILWYKKAAEQNSIIAMNKLGSTYYYAHKEEYKNPEEGIRYFEMAANLGDINAMGELGDIFNDGIKVDCDPVKAMKWYYLAARYGDYTAEEPLEDLYTFMNTEDIEKAETLAREWIQKYGK